MSNGQTEEQQFNQDDQMNGDGNDNNVDTGAAEAPGKDDDRKLFVGGLSWETSDKELRDHFGSYGTIDSINVKTDPNTGRSRGFAFIVFKEASSIDKVLAAGDHVINNKKIDPKKAKARHGKIFVGGLSSDLSDDDIKNYFNQFGTIVEVEMPYDKQKNQRKGFCFITFESEQIVSELLKTPKQNINGKEVDVKKATPKPDGMASIRGMRGMRGGGYGPGAYGPGYGGYGYGSGYDYYGNGYGSGYGSGYGYDAYGYGSYGGYDGYGYGSGYDGGYGAGGGGGGRGGGRGGKGKGSGGYGKQRGGGRGGARHAPY